MIASTFISVQYRTKKQVGHTIRKRFSFSLVEKMTDPDKSMYNKKTVILRVLMVTIYVAFGSVIFDLLERDEASKRVSAFEQYYNNTMMNILGRYISNATEIKIVMNQIRGTFLQDVFPKEWDVFGGINITIHAITTIG